MMPGFSMSALMRRMAEKRMPRAALEKRWSQAVATFSVITISLHPARARCAETPQYMTASRGHRPVPPIGLSHRTHLRKSWS
jgi:hypothetical protein